MPSCLLSRLDTYKSSVRSDLFIQPHKFDPKKSTTAKATGRTFKLTYADGTHVSGDVYTDNLTVASFATKSHAIGVATESTFKDEGTDGICGLAFQVGL